jgi:hypothetical protein
MRWNGSAPFLVTPRAGGSQPVATLQAILAIGEQGGVGKLLEILHGGGHVA